MRRPARVLALALALAFLLPLSHADAAEGRVTAPTVTGGELSLQFSAVGLPEGADLDRKSVAVTVDGRRVHAVAEHLGTSSSTSPRSTMLLIDVSGSMAGPRIAAARSAAEAFLDQLPTDVAVGVITFASSVQVVAPPSRDRARAREAVTSLRAEGDTRLYDSLITAAHELGTDGNRTIVLLSDGADDGSQATLESSTEALRASGVELTAVAVEADKATTDALSAIAGASAGRVVPVHESTALASVLRSAARDLEEQLHVRADLPPDLLGRAVSVEVTVNTSVGSVTAQTTLDVPAAPPAPSPPDAGPTPSAAAGAASDKRPLALGLAVLFLGFALGVATLVQQAATSRSRRVTLQLLGEYGQQQPERHLEQQSMVTESALQLADRVAAWRGIGAWSERHLEAAALPWRPREWLMLLAGSATAAGVLLALLGAGIPGFVVGAVIGLASPVGWLKSKAARRRAAFADSLPDALQLVTSGLTTGYSFAQALDSVVSDGAQPIAGEIGRALAESRLGTPLEDCLDAVADRMQSADFHWVVLAVRVQREIGGNLAEVLHTVFETMRERARLRRQVRTLSAEGRMSAWVLIGLPVFMAGYQFLFRRDYMRPLWQEPIGLLMLTYVAVSLLIGALWTRKLVKVEA